MKKVLVGLLIIIQIFILVSCDFGALAYVKSNQLQIYTLASYNIPGFSDGYDLHVEMVQEDSYGRKMYRLSCFSQSGSFYIDGYNETEGINIRAYVVSQKETKEGVYYLDSICYMIRLSWDDFTAELLDEFKTLNHWEMELDHDNLCYRTLPKKNAGINVDPLFAEVNNAYEQHTGKVATTGNVYIQYVCNDSLGKCLAFVREFDETSEKNAYVIIVAPSDSGKVNLEYYITELDDFYQQNDAVKALKEEAGWVSPKE